MGDISTTQAIGDVKVTVNGAAAEALGDYTFKDGEGADLTADDVGGAVRVLITIDDGEADVRYRYTGTAPTATDGHLLTEGDRGVTVEGKNNLRNLQLISTDAGGSAVHITLEA